MTRYDIIRIAREAGFFCDADWITYGLPGVERFAALVAAHEREVCADICDKFQARDVGMQPAECAAAIRARGES